MEHFDNIGGSQTQLDETYTDRAQMENTIDISNEGIVSHPPTISRVDRGSPKNMSA